MAVKRHLVVYKTKKMLKFIVTPDMKYLDKEIIRLTNSVSTMGHKEFKILLNNLLWLKLITKDISLLRIKYKSEKNPAQRNLTARLLASQLHEFFHDIIHLYGQVFRKEVASTIPSNYLDLLREIKALTSRGYDLHKKNLLEVRLNVSSHRDKNAFKQAKMIKDLDEKRIIDACDFALFMIYWFDVVHQSYFRMILKRLNQKPAYSRFFDDDLKLWEMYSEYFKEQGWISK